MHAQTINTLTVCGDSTTTNECIPIYGYFANHKPKCEFIIPAAKLNAMNGGVVSAMKFYLIVPFVFCGLTSLFAESVVVRVGRKTEIVSAPVRG